MYNVHRFIYGETLSIEDMRLSKSLATTTFTYTEVAQSTSVLNGFLQMGKKYFMNF